MTLEILQVIWFVLVAVLLTGYALLDGFDLGVGNLHLFTTNREERQAMFYSIGPFWDSNQVWLLTGGGAIFAAFPMVYATVFSGFYLALMLLLLALIFRAVSIEFQHLINSPRWQRAWDWGFALGSILPSILFGVAVGNILKGIPLDPGHNFAGSFLGLLNPYSLLLGFVSLTMFTMHGAAFLALRTEGSLQQKARRWGLRCWLFYLPLFLAATAFSYAGTPRLFHNFFQAPVLLLLPLLSVCGLIIYPLAMKKECRWKPFLASCLIILGNLSITAASLFPYLVPASTNLEYSLTIYNASSSQLTLTVMFILALIGMPLVIFYSTYIYRKLTKPVTPSASLSSKLTLPR